MSEVRRYSSPPAILTELGLSADELAALSRQGFVSRGWRRPGLAVYKLRFRLGGRQQVRYLGADPRQAEAVRQALVAWQKPQLAVKRLRAVAREAAAVLRRMKQRLQPVVLSAGFEFHGLALRRSRKTR